jgi:signal transduction histidine kinase
MDAQIETDPHAPVRGGLGRLRDLRPETARRLARSILALDLAMSLAGIALFLPDPSSIPLAVVLSLAALGWGGVGALIAARAPRNPIGWLLLTAATAAAYQLLSVAYSAWGPTLGTAPLPFAVVTGWFAIAVAAPIGIAAIPLLFLLYPDGGLPSRRWRPVAACALLLAPAIAVITIREGDLDRGLAPPTWAAASPLLTFVDLITIAALATAVIGAVASLWVRTRRAEPTERGHIRWVLVLVTAMVAVVPLPFVVAALGGEAWIGFVLAAMVVIPGVLFGIPLAFSIVLLRYGLYDYEVRMRKRIVAGALATSLTLAALFVYILLTQAFGGGIREAEVQSVLIGVVGAVVTYAAGRLFAGFARRVVFGERATPYEVLSDFSERIGETYSVDDVLPRMAELLAVNTGAREARVWLASGRELRPVATWPPDAPAVEPVAFDHAVPLTFVGDRVAFPVLHRGEVLGALSILAATNDPMNPAKDRLAQDLAAQAGLVLRNVALVEDLRESRRRIVDAQDTRARKLERDIHDGAQQQLVALSVKLRLAGTVLDRDPEKARAILAEVQGEANDALETLRDLARGIYPPLLADAGLEPALTAQARKSTIPVTVHADGIGRYARATEAAVYFSVSEALANIAKYADATEARITLSESGGHLRFEVRDDGRGFDPDAASLGTGLRGMADRLEAVGGSLSVESTPGDGTTVRGLAPAASPP